MYVSASLLLMSRLSTTSIMSDPRTGSPTALSSPLHSAYLESDQNLKIRTSALSPPPISLLTLLSPILASLLPLPVPVLLSSASSILSYFQTSVKLIFAATLSNIGHRQLTNSSSLSFHLLGLFNLFPLPLL
jgi:hypothetical protein